MRSGSATVVARSVAELLGAGVEPGSVVCAAMSEGPVIGWLVVEEGTAGADDRRCAVVRLEGCSVVAAGPVSEAMVSGSPVPTDDAMPVWAAALAGAFWGAQRARAERDTSPYTRPRPSWMAANGSTKTLARQPLRA
jgi:hypothetical protein